MTPEKSCVIPICLQRIQSIQKRRPRDVVVRCGRSSRANTLPTDAFAFGASVRIERRRDVHDGRT